MANTAKFDRQEVIEKATQLYWQKGFHATSMRNLQEVVDLRPGSIYSAFGSKEGLFREALEHYTNQSIELFHQVMEQASSYKVALEQFVLSLVEARECSAPSELCMLAKTVSELTSENGELLEEAASAMARVEGEFAKVIQLAQDAGEFSPERDAEQLARHLQIQIIGLRTYLKARGDKASAKQMVSELFNHYPF